MVISLDPLRQSPLLKELKLVQMTKCSGSFVLVFHSSRSRGPRAPTVFPAFGNLLGPTQREESVMSHENVRTYGPLSFANAAAAS
jgi:hypothetical protein